MPNTDPLPWVKAVARLRRQSIAAARATGGGPAQTSAGPSSLELACAASSPSSVSESRVSPLSDSSAAGAGASGAAGAGAGASPSGASPSVAAGMATGAGPSAVTTRRVAAAVAATAGASAACGSTHPCHAALKHAAEGGTRIDTRVGHTDGVRCAWGCADAWNGSQQPLRGHGHHRHPPCMQTQLWHQEDSCGIRR